MPQLPFEIPKSLASYADHFEEDPIKATTRLKKQLRKRGPDAVGHFLLAWFYHLKGMDDQAVEEALKARIFAPGSPFFKKLHYYLSHPKAFEAWTPKTPSTSQPTTSRNKEHGPVLNLDTLIEKLSSVESQRITADGNESGNREPKKTVSSDNVDDIVSETLASIHERQEKYDAAIRTYEQLQRLNQAKKEYYAEQITRLRKKKSDRSQQ